MEIGILGAGLAGVSLASMLQECEKIARIELLEKQPVAGGLCRSFPFGRLHYDLGPHIIFSKNADVLKMMVEVLGENVHRLRRANKVFHDGRFVKYPFENGLAGLSQSDRQYCLNTFLGNPYADYPPQNMLQFFLATFGEGITNLYLRPYNEKIWKFDPAMMDTQMVQRVPRPPAEDVVRSAEGAETEGYLHQLYFYYPRTGGIESLFRAFQDKLESKVAVRLGVEVEKLERAGGKWQVSSADGRRREYDRLVSTIPLPQLIAALGPRVPQKVVRAAGALKFNSLAVCAIRLGRDNLGESFAIMVADRQVLFHRVTRLNFLLPKQPEQGTTSLLAEVTFRKGDMIDKLTDDELRGRVVEDLQRLGFIDGASDVEATELRRVPCAYVIYDLHHGHNLKTVRDWCEGELGLVLHGRFGQFEYLSMDAVIGRSIDRCSQIRGTS